MKNCENSSEVNVGGWEKVLGHSRNVRGVKNRQFTPETWAIPQLRTKNIFPCKYFVGFPARKILEIAPKL